MQIKGLAAMVTGGGSGLGAVTAAHLASLGAKVAVVDINQSAAEAQASKIGGIGLKCDVADGASGEAAFAAAWPEATLMNLLDDSLSADLARDGALTPAMTERFRRLGAYARGTGADGILFTCSAFGPCIDAVAGDSGGMPVLKPNEAMIEDAVAAAIARAAGRRPRIGLIASFAPTLVSMPPEFPASVDVVPILADGALAALEAERTGDHGHGQCTHLAGRWPE